MAAAPSGGLLRAVAIVFACACFTPAWAPALAIAAVAAAGLALAAGLDRWLALAAGPRLQVAIAGAEATPAGPRLRWIAGRETPLALTLSRRGDSSGPLRVGVALMAADADFERHVGLPEGVTPLTLTGSGPWRQSFTVQVKRRGRCAGLRCGVEYASALGLWRIRQWEVLPESFSIYPDLAPGRRDLMRSPVYRALVAAAAVPLTGQGREFERLREYQPGDSFGDISWKSTARRGAPVTRLFQWEQRQQIYFVVDHSRSSGRETGGAQWLDRYVETALAGAAAAIETGDEFGLISFTDRVTHWLPAGSGLGHFGHCRELAVELARSPATADFDRLFAGIRARLRRRAYLLMLTNLSEPGMAEPFSRAASLVSGTHLILAAGILPREARPLFTGPEARDLEEVYAQLAGDLELQRLEALTRALARQGIRLRVVPETGLMRAAVEGYLESKQEQRL